MYGMVVVIGEDGKCRGKNGFGVKIIKEKWVCIHVIKLTRSIVSTKQTNKQINRGSL